MEALVSHSVKCDCCQTETMAVITGNRLVIKDKRHGRQHVAVVVLDKTDEPCNTQERKLNTDA